ncbi:MAG: V-type ATP synthase subunit I [Tissierellia bacterium]|nr:V-type ATP synthase subunit I [Tissierellia bacterium]
MNKISIIGLGDVKTRLIRELMDLGVVEISSQDSKLTDSEWISYVEKDGDESEVLNLEADISKVNSVLVSLDKYDKTKKPMFSSKKTVSIDEFENKVLDNKSIIENVGLVLNLNNNLNELTNEENKIVSNILSLKPWIKYGLPLELSETKYTSIFTGVVPNVSSSENLINEVKEKVNTCFIELINSDKDQNYLSVICLKSDKDEVFELLKQYGFNTVVFKDLIGTAAENIVKYEKEISETSNKKKQIEADISESVQYIDDIQLYYDYLVIERDKLKSLDNILKTNKTFYIEGWLPQKSKEKVESVLKQNECWYEINEPEEGEEFPILLDNNTLVDPFEVITGLYSLPSSSNIDPTSSMWFFFVFFFGMMLGDVGYGLILALACGLVVKMFKLEGTSGKMLKSLFWCGISTMFWGVMFGSYFGDGIVAAAKTIFNVDIIIKPFWTNPMEDPMNVLIVSFAFGLIHLFVGLGVKAYMLIRDGKPLDALYDVGFWYLFIIGPVLLLAGGTISPVLVIIGKYMTIIGMIGLVLTQGREKKNIISKLTSGVLSLYGITGYLSDVLSYSRLLALGLATGVISSVLSIMGSMGGHTIIGIILFLVVFVIGHSLNFAINALGAFVHSARLQYVEFFGKFYEGGGEPFNPLTKKTKYIKIIKEEN